MPGDPQECREHAKRCWALASQSRNSALKESLIELAQRWASLATDLETTQRLLDEWGDPRLELKNPACDDPRDDHRQKERRGA